MKKYGSPCRVVTDGCGAYSAAMKEIGSAGRHEVGRRLNNRAENSRQPFRRRERAMRRFRSLKTLRKFSSVHAQVHNQFNQERHLVARQDYKQRRSAALAEWRGACGVEAACQRTCRTSASDRCCSDSLRGWRTVPSFVRRAHSIGAYRLNATGGASAEKTIAQLVTTHQPCFSQTNGFETT
jgi:hypothetical protein